MSILSLNAKLDRTEQSTPWGFRMHGGKDFGSPLTIQRVTPGSLAANCGLQVGDAIVKIGDTPTDGLLHKDAQQTILRYRNGLELTLQRGGAVGLGRRPEPAAAAPPAPSAFSPVQQPAGHSPYQQQNYGGGAKPYGGGADHLSSQTANMNLGPSSPSTGMTTSSASSPSSSVASSLHEESSATVKPHAASSSPVPPWQQQPNHSPSSSIITTTSISSSLAAATVVSSHPTTTTTTTTTTTKIPPTQSARYEDQANSDSPRYRGYQNPNVQSRTFKLLQEQVESGKEVQPGLAVSKKPELAQKPTFLNNDHTDHPQASKAIVNKQYNTPMSLYSDNTATSSFNTQSSSIIAGLQRDDEQVVTESRKTIVVPSKTFQMVQQQEKEEVEPVERRTYVPPENYRIVQVEEEHSPPLPSTGPPPAPSSGPPPMVSAYQAPSITPSTRPPPENEVKMYKPSETFRLIQKQDQRSTEPQCPPPSSVSMSSGSVPQIHQTVKTFQIGQLIDQSSAPKYNAPKPAAAPAAPVARPGSWQPKVPTGPRTPKFGKTGDARSMPAPSAAGRLAICNNCGNTIRGPFVSALEKTWCPDHFVCANPHCGTQLLDCGFVEEGGQLFCEADYEQYFAPRCGKCGRAIVGEVVNALKNTYHTQCFLCVHCRQPIGSGSFHIEDGNNYCETDWAAMFQTKCYGCQFPIEPGDRWVEALSQNWHSECFNCSTCQVNLEGQSFFAKAGKPYCKRHASR